MFIVRRKSLAKKPAGGDGGDSFAQLVTGYDRMIEDDIENDLGI